MTHSIDTIATGFIAVAATAMGSKTARLLAELSAPPMPEWMTWLVGPLGALIGLVLALKWMNARLDKTEAKADAKELARDAESKDERDRLIVALERSTVVMASVEKVISGCHAPRSGDR